MIFVGVDPGSRCMGIAGVDEGNNVRFVQALRASSREVMICKILGAMRCTIGIEDIQFAVEDQEYRQTRGKGSPETLFPLAQVAGAAYARLTSEGTTAGPGRFVTPMEWKGTVPKLQHHRRMLEAMGWPYDEIAKKNPYCVPNFTIWKPKGEILGLDQIAGTEWPEVLDAIGIARWLRNQHLSPGGSIHA